jgi:lipopolysaccharide assembly outer membrane protein LptD (OstA)
MVPSCRKAQGLLRCGLLACAALAAAPAAPAAPPAPPPPAAAPTAPAKAAAPLGSRQLPITVDAASSEVDYRTNTVVFSEVVISQGVTRIQADHAHASGLNFANSRWTFEGHVRIDA